MKQASYPDVSDLLARKAAGRREIAAKTFGEKLQMLNDMRRRAAALRSARPIEARPGLQVDASSLKSSAD